MIVYQLQVWGSGEKTLTHNKTVIQTLAQRRSTRLQEGTLGTGGGRSWMVVPPAAKTASQGELVC